MMMHGVAVRPRMMLHGALSASGGGGPRPPSPSKFMSSGGGEAAKLFFKGRAKQMPLWPAVLGGGAMIAYAGRQMMRRGYVGNASQNVSNLQNQQNAMYSGLVSRGRSIL